MNPDLLFLLVVQLLYGYYYLLIVYIILGWLGNVRESGFYQFLGILCEPFFRIFRGWLVFGMFDLTPVLGLVLYQLVLEMAVGNFFGI